MNIAHRPPRLAIVLLAILVVPAAAVACLWDYDTIRDERRGLPGIAEVLAGKWEKHSAFFYENRVARMTSLIAKEPANWPAYDNLAVALEKLGRPDEAIVVMRQKDGLNPGQYTTHANLGTFLLHTGKVDEGIDEIRKALAINPAAHFGREEYQLKLAEFLRDGKKDPRLLTAENFLGLGQSDLPELQAFLSTTLPATAAATTTALPPTIPSATAPTTMSSDSYESLRAGLVERRARRMAGGGSPDVLRNGGLKDNVFDGLVGIIRFGTGRSAELYLTLGDLLLLRGDKNLAYRAYQRAIDFGHPRGAYLQAAMDAIRETAYDKSALTPQVITAERADADSWVRAYQQYEDDLIRAGKDPEVEANLIGFYKANGPAVAPEKFDFVEDVLPRQPAQRVALGINIALVLAGLATGYVGLRIYRRRRRKGDGVTTR